jgi:predicted kinase
MREIQELVLLRGLPGSGKSTTAHYEYAMPRGYIHVEADDWFKRNNEPYKFDPQQLAYAHTHCAVRAENALRNGRSVVVANTFSRNWEMESYRDIARRLNVHVHIRTCTGEWPNVHGVPQATIDRMRLHWEW